MNHCDAKPPKFAVTVGGMDFYISSEDLMPTGVLNKGTDVCILVVRDQYANVRLPTDPKSRRCVTGIQPMKDGASILGDSFLKNVIAVFDIGASEMRFAARGEY